MYSGGRDASAIPKHSGTATKKTTKLAGKSFLRFFKKEKSEFVFILIK